jgi:hypothetical protein
MLLKALEKAWFAVDAMLSEWFIKKSVGPLVSSIGAA